MSKPIKLPSMPDPWNFTRPTVEGYARLAVEQATAELHAENDALRAALQFIADHDLRGTDLIVAGHIAHALIGKARAALKEAK